VVIVFSLKFINQTQFGTKMKEYIAAGLLFLGGCNVDGEKSSHNESVIKVGQATNYDPLTLLTEPGNSTPVNTPTIDAKVYEVSPEKLLQLNKQYDECANSKHLVKSGGISMQPIGNGYWSEFGAKNTLNLVAGMLFGSVDVLVDEDQGSFTLLGTYNPQVHDPEAFMVAKFEADVSPRDCRITLKEAIQAELKVANKAIKDKKAANQGKY
jgi:hypothetical protein